MQLHHEHLSGHSLSHLKNFRFSCHYHVWVMDICCGHLICQHVRETGSLTFTATKSQHTQSPDLQHQNMGQWRKYEASIYLNGGVSECRQRHCVLYKDFDCFQSLYLQTGYLPQDIGYLVNHTTCSARTFTYKLKTTNSLLPPFYLMNIV
jgi:hypothetical protein